MSTISIGTNAQLFDVPRAEVGSGAYRSFVGLAAILIAIVTIVPIEQSWMRSTYENFDATADEMEALARDGTLTRQIALGSFGLCGLAAICWPGGKVLRVRHVVGVLCVAYLAWCAVSCLWSDDLGLSLKRWIALICEVAGALAIAKRCSPKQFVWIALLCTLAWLGLGIAAELSLGTFRPWQQEYRFAGIFHPNEMGINCAILTLSALYLANGTRSRTILWAVAALSFVFLLLTGSRTALGTAIVAMTALWVLTAPGGKSLWRLTIAGMAAVLVSAFLAFESIEEMSSLVAMGRTGDGLSTLTGRLPLWQELLQDYAQRQPLIGCGYGAFWSADHIYEVSKSQSWPVSSSHSTYIDLFLNVGYVGAALYVSAMVLAVISLWRLEARHAGIGYGFMAALVIFTLIAGFLETTVSLGSLLAFFSMCGVCYLMVGEENGLRQVPQHAVSPLNRNLARHRQ